MRHWLIFRRDDFGKWPWKTVSNPCKVNNTLFLFTRLIDKFRVWPSHLTQPKKQTGLVHLSKEHCVQGCSDGSELCCLQRQFIKNCSMYDLDIWLWPSKVQASPCLTYNRRESREVALAKLTIILPNYERDIVTLLQVLSVCASQDKDYNLNLAQLSSINKRRPSSIDFQVRDQRISFSRQIWQ